MNRAIADRVLDRLAAAFPGHQPLRLWDGRRGYVIALNGWVVKSEREAQQLAPKRRGKQVSRGQ